MAAPLRLREWFVTVDHSPPAPVLVVHGLLEDEQEQPSSLVVKTRLDHRIFEDEQGRTVELQGELSADRASLAGVPDLWTTFFADGFLQRTQFLLSAAPPPFSLNLSAAFPPLASTSNTPLRPSTPVKSSSALSDCLFDLGLGSSSLLPDSPKTKKEIAQALRAAKARRAKGKWRAEVSEEEREGRVVGKDRDEESGEEEEEDKPGEEEETHGEDTEMEDPEGANDGPEGKGKTERESKQDDPGGRSAPSPAPADPPLPPPDTAHPQSQPPESSATTLRYVPRQPPSFHSHISSIVHAFFRLPFSARVDENLDLRPPELRQEEAARPTITLSPALLLSRQEKTLLKAVAQPIEVGGAEEGASANGGDGEGAEVAEPKEKKAVEQDSAPEEEPIQSPMEVNGGEDVTMEDATTEAGPEVLVETSVEQVEEVEVTEAVPALIEDVSMDVEAQDALEVISQAPPRHPSPTPALLSRFATPPIASSDRHSSVDPLPSSAVKSNGFSAIYQSDNEEADDSAELTAQEISAFVERDLASSVVDEEEHESDRSKQKASKPAERDSPRANDGTATPSVEPLEAVASALAPLATLQPAPAASPRPARQTPKATPPPISSSSPLHVPDFELPFLLQLEQQGKPPSPAAAAKSASPRPTPPAFPALSDPPALPLVGLTPVTDPVAAGEQEQAPQPASTPSLAQREPSPQPPPALPEPNGNPGSDEPFQKHSDETAFETARSGASTPPAQEDDTAAAAREVVEDVVEEVAAEVTGEVVSQTVGTLVEQAAGEVVGEAVGEMAGQAVADVASGIVGGAAGAVLDGAKELAEYFFPAEDQSREYGGGGEEEEQEESMPLSQTQSEGDEARAAEQAALEVHRIAEETERLWQEEAEKEKAMWRKEIGLPQSQSQSQSQPQEKSKKGKQNGMKKEKDPKPFRRSAGLDPLSLLAPAPVSNKQQDQPFAPTAQTVFPARRNDTAPVSSFYEEPPAVPAASIFAPVSAQDVFGPVKPTPKASSRKASSKARASSVAGTASPAPLRRTRRSPRARTTSASASARSPVVAAPPHPASAEQPSPPSLTQTSLPPPADKALSPHATAPVKPAALRQRKSQFIGVEIPVKTPPKKGKKGKSRQGSAAPAAKSPTTDTAALPPAVDGPPAEPRPSSPIAEPVEEAAPEPAPPTSPLDDFRATLDQFRTTLDEPAATAPAIPARSPSPAPEPLSLLGADPASVFPTASTSALLPPPPAAAAESSRSPPPAPLNGSASPPLPAEKPPAPASPPASEPEWVTSPGKVTRPVPRKYGSRGSASPTKESEPAPPARDAQEDEEEDDQQELPRKRTRRRSSGSASATGGRRKARRVVVSKEPEVEPEPEPQLGEEQLEAVVEEEQKEQEDEAQESDEEEDAVVARALLKGKAIVPDEEETYDDGGGGGQEYGGGWDDFVVGEQQEELPKEPFGMVHVDEENELLSLHPKPAPTPSPSALSPPPRPTRKRSAAPAASAEPAPALKKKRADNKDPPVRRPSLAGKKPRASQPEPSPPHAPSPRPNPRKPRQSLQATYGSTKPPPATPVAASSSSSKRRRQSTASATATAAAATPGSASRPQRQRKPVQGWWEIGRGVEAAEAGIVSPRKRPREEEQVEDGEEEREEEQVEEEEEQGAPAPPPKKMRGRPRKVVPVVQSTLPLPDEVEVEQEEVQEEHEASVQPVDEDDFDDLPNGSGAGDTSFDAADTSFEPDPSAHDDNDDQEEPAKPTPAQTKDRPGVRKDGKKRRKRKSVIMPRFKHRQSTAASTAAAPSPAPSPKKKDQEQAPRKAELGSARQSNVKKAAREKVREEKKPRVVDGAGGATGGKGRKGKKAAKLPEWAQDGAWEGMSEFRIPREAEEDEYRFSD
ncbi:hypothetical protein JCM8547_000472 [Rhodosporidiobolus lusitaniae]